MRTVWIVASWEKIFTSVGNPNVINNYHLGMVYKLIPNGKPRYDWDGLWLSLRHLVMQNLMFSYGRWLKFIVALKDFWGIWLFWVPPCMSEVCVDLPSRNQLICGPGISSNRSWQSLMSQRPAGGAGAAHESWPYRGLALNMPRKKWSQPKRCHSSDALHARERSPSDMIHARCL